MALLTFFEISTTEAWTEVMYAAVDATDEDMQPIREAHLARVWFFMLFMLIGSYLVMNLFVGVIIDNFNKVNISNPDVGELRGTKVLYTSTSGFDETATFHTEVESGEIGCPTAQNTAAVKSHF